MFQFWKERHEWLNLTISKHDQVTPRDNNCRYARESTAILIARRNHARQQFLTWPKLSLNSYCTVIPLSSAAFSTEVFISYGWGTEGLDFFRHWRHTPSRRSLLYPLTWNPFSESWSWRLILIQSVDCFIRFQMSSPFGPLFKGTY